MSTIDDDRLSREHHVRRRAELVRVDLDALWGDDLPPGPDPRTTELVDALALDDDRGRRQGLLVQGDAVPFHLLVRLLSTSPLGASVLAELPAAVRARVDLAGAAARGLPTTPSGAFAVRAEPPVVDLDERVSALLGLPARPHRLPRGEVLRRVHPADVALVAGATRAAFDDRASLSVRFRVVLADGTVRWLSAVGHALTGEDGRTEQVVGFTTPSP